MVKNSPCMSPFIPAGKVICSQVSHLFVCIDDLQAHERGIVNCAWDADCVVVVLGVSNVPIYGPLIKYVQHMSKL